MRYVIVGAGGVGGTIGAHLHRAGREVHLVARGAHGRAIREHGLRLRRPDAPDAVLDIPATTDLVETALRPDDVIVLTCKSQDTTAILEVVSAASIPGGGRGCDLAVVSAQNGVANERMALRRFERVYGICVMLPATRSAPGVVDSHGMPYAARLDVGRYPTGTDDLAETMSGDLVAAGLLSQPEPEVMRWKYAKLLSNLANAIEALTGGRSGEVYELTVAEAHRVFHAAGISPVSNAEWFGRRGRTVTATARPGEPDSRGSSWQSLAGSAGRIEADYLNGEIVLLAREHGARAPVNALLQRLTNAAAADHARPGAMPEADLLSQVRAVANG